MAAVFDLDLETEEGSEGEGEPEFSPAVSGPPGRGSIPARSRLDSIIQAMGWPVRPPPPPCPQSGLLSCRPRSKIPATIRL